MPWLIHKPSLELILQVLFKLLLGQHFFCFSHNELHIYLTHPKKLPIHTPSLELIHQVLLEISPDKDDVHTTHTRTHTEGQGKHYIMIISKSYIAHVSTKQGTQGTSIQTNFQKDRLLQWCILRHKHVALIRVYKVLRRMKQPQPGTLGQTPSLFTWDQQLYVPSESKATVKCLA